MRIYLVVLFLGFIIISYQQFTMANPLTSILGLIGAGMILLSLWGILKRKTLFVQIGILFFAIYTLYALSVMTWMILSKEAVVSIVFILVLCGLNIVAILKIFRFKNEIN